MVMRLGLISTYLPQECGVARYTSFLAEALIDVDSSLEIRVIAERGAEPVRGDRVEVLPCWQRDGKYQEEMLDQTEDLDLIHVQHEYSIYGFDNRLPAFLESLPSDIRKIVTIHCVRPAQFSPRGDLDERYAARIAQLADRVIVHLDSQRAILTRCGVDEEKISVIPHGTMITDEDRDTSRGELGLSGDVKLLLMFGFIKRHKCYEVALDALYEIMKERDDVYLFIAGTLHPSAKRDDKMYLESIKDKISELGLDEHVIFPDIFYPDEEVPNLMAASDIVLFHYFEEDRSASGALHLAIGAGRPVIATRIPKFEELRNVSDELLVLPFSPSGLAQLARRILGDDGFREYILRRIDLYRRETSWHAVARKHLEVYE
ncbi:MAG: glycosyltransferase [Candidatus Syntrophoarchaeum sp. WYZ-LMO15]|nr:MAG: glycosyltransferase [Candidatus Syntrophoarchaeum sp. WYZ-LMO15]